MMDDIRVESFIEFPFVKEEWIPRIQSFVYRNYKGSTRPRIVIPFYIHHGTTAYYPQPGWLMHAWDLEKSDWRDFSFRRLIYQDCALTPEGLERILATATFPETVRIPIPPFDRIEDRAG
jgi:hypothetical protein